MLIEESEKLYTSLIKEWVDKIITDYTFNIISSLALLSSSDDKEQQPEPLIQRLPAAEEANQSTYME